MKKTWGWVGTVLFWLLWPVWVCYFKLSGRRSRVLVVAQNEVLLVQGWLGTKSFGLPGGGNKKHESPVASATRELEEETGIMVTESSLQKLGSRYHSRYKLRYRADFFVLRLSEKPALKLSKPEIFTAVWISLTDALELKLDDDTTYALKRYQPSEQASLL